MRGIRKKTAADENFPVASLLIKKELRPLVKHYYNLARLADDIADNPRLKPREKLLQLNDLEDIFLNLKKTRRKKWQAAVILHEDFVKEQLDFSLVTDLFTAFRRDAENFRYQTWAQLTDYCRYSAVPVGRFMLAIHNENPATYLPAAALCTVLQIVNHIQDIKYDCLQLDRIYLPAEMMKEFGVAKKDLGAAHETPQLRRLINFILGQMRGLLKEAALLPQILQSRRLKTEVCVILSLTNIMIKKIEKGDVLEKDIRFSRPERLLGLITGIGRALTARKKTLPGKGF